MEFTEGDDEDDVMVYFGDMVYHGTLPHEMAIDVVVYDGQYDNYTGDCSYGECRRYPSDHGVPDCAENHANPVWRRFTVDAEPPTVEFLSEESSDEIEIKICDPTSGVDENSILIGDMTIDDFNYMMENDDKDTRAEFKETSNHCGILTIGPIAEAVDWDLEISDAVGNFTVEEIKRGGEVVEVMGVKFYPNPFDPETDGYGKFAYDLTKGATVTIKIYDFAGVPVATVVDEYRSAGGHIEEWYGENGGGDVVAPGAYIGFVKIDDGHKVITKNLKIAVGKHSE
jgi:hypothetical protein